MLAPRLVARQERKKMTTNGISSFSTFACGSGSLEELLAGATLSCPCCNGRLTPEKLARLFDDVQRLARERAVAGNGHEPQRSAGAYAGMIIDPHTHMISRTTDDYEAMARAGVVAVIEPAFWLGQPRTTVGSFIDYFTMISGFERFRAGQFGIRHYCTIGLNPKEANNEALAEAVIDALPRFLTREGVVAMGELGYDEQTAAEDKALRAQIELAKEFELPIMIHTPHRDKRPGTLRTMDVLKEHGFDPMRCVIDHNNEETIREVRDRGYWCAFSIYPNTKMGSERMAALVKSYGPERLIVDSACDWGVSDPLAVVRTARLMAEHGVAAEAIHQVVYANALAVYGLNTEMREEHWLAPSAIDQRTLYEGNSVLRGGQTPRIDTPASSL
jgi:predicted metal-dependent TIM-barrel fold hydrolase